MVTPGDSYSCYYYLTDGRTEAWFVSIVGWRQILSELSRFSKSAWNSRTHWAVPWAGAGWERGSLAGPDGFVRRLILSLPLAPWDLSSLILALLTPSFGVPCPPDYWYSSMSPPITVAFLTLSMFYNYHDYLVPFYYLSISLYLSEYQSCSYYIPGASHRARHVVDSE